VRPEILFPLFVPVATLPGIGPRLAETIGRLAGPKVVDLLWHLPTGVVDRRAAPPVAGARPGEVATLTVRVLRHMEPASRRQPYKVLCADDSAEIVLVFFHGQRDYLRRMLPEGQTRVVSGVVDHYGAEIQMAHPDYMVTEAERDSMPAIEPVYPLTAGLTGKPLVRAVAAALDRLPDLPEWLDGSLREREGWPSWATAVRAAHAPESLAAVEGATPARARLAYDELLANQLALAVVRHQQRTLPGRALTAPGELGRKIVDSLPFPLTGSQEQAIEEIRADLAADARMLRLLQGDVGSGKTLVALMAMATAAEAGAQAALMAPTEILARQHHATVAPLAAAAGLEVALLTGRDKGKSRADTLAALADGTASIAIGTHALFQEDVAFADLRLAVIDEQHRFGVHQRLDLASKGHAVDILVMTATPIPRTLMLTAYGDMDVSRLTEKPPGRRPVDTRVMPLGRLDDVVAAVGRSLDTGAKVYWVCPLVEESEALDVAAAEDRARHLRDVFGDRVGLIHGRMKAADRDAAMAAFVDGPKDVLVATTVIEVGVDVPAATVMVVEHAERFGLAQLHQLRGRIGRGERPSTCLLVYAPPLSDAARARLAIMRETEDGFRIAEEDLRLRGAGELLGTRQSGLPAFRIADLALHGDLLAMARDDARLALNRDPDLTTDRGWALRVLLYLFERDAAVRYLRSG